MSDVVRARPVGTPVQSPDGAGMLANAAATTEIAARAVVGAVGVRALIAVVRDHPMLTVLLASGVGYLLGNGLRKQPARAPAPR